MKGLKIISTGSCLPEKIVTNDDLSRIVDTSDEWIRSRTGIKIRRFCESETNCDLAMGAARAAMERAGIEPGQIGLVIVATFTPDYAIPSTACLLQRELNLPEDIPAFDISAACTGFLYALKTAHAMLHTLPRPYALVVGSEVLSRVIDFSDRSTCVLFGDGAGAAVITLDEDHPFICNLGARGEGEMLGCPAGGPDRYIHMDGPAVFRFATDIAPRCIDNVLKSVHLTLDDIDQILCHQANARIISHVMKKLNVPEEKFFTNLQHYGNTSAASIPIALDEMARGGILSPGMRVLCVGFGGGLTWGGALIHW